MNIKAIIFDWGRTLYDHEKEGLMEGAEEILKHCSKNYTLGLVSLTTRQSIQERQQKIADLGLDKYFSVIELVDQDKEAAYDRVVKKLGIPPAKLAIVDDRAVRGIKWGHHHGCTTIWLQKGKFANELPNEETGGPTHTIHELGELMNIL